MSKSKSGKQKAVSLQSLHQPQLKNLLSRHNSPSLDLIHQSRPRQSLNRQHRTRRPEIIHSEPFDKHFGGVLLFVVEIYDVVGYFEDVSLRRSRGLQT